MTKHFDSLPGLTGVISEEKRIRLSQFDARNASTDAYLQAGLYPTVVATLSLIGVAAVAPQPKLDPIVFQSGDAMPCFKGADNAALSELARRLTRPETGKDFTPAQRQAIRLTTVVCEGLLRFERDTFHANAASFDYFYDNETILPGQTRTTHWHQHGDAKRVYLVRAAAPPEIIRDTIAQLGDTGRGLVTDMANKHRLSPRDYLDWETRARAAGLFFQPAAYEVALISGRSWHRSHQVKKPVPSSFMALAVS